VMFIQEEVNGAIILDETIFLMWNNFKR